MRRLFITLSCLFVGALAVHPDSAAAESKRIAVIVGNNTATAALPTLAYAHRDAKEMAAVLRNLGGVERVHLLLDKSADDLRAALTRLEGEIAARSGSTVMFFYYSGHADNESLMMGTSRFSFSELRERLDSLPADIAVSFIDACESGRITRSKGGRAVPVTNVTFGGDRDLKGRVYVTSSAPNERSQESDTLRASFFTHYLLTGLRGAADVSGDRRVSLQEAYQFAYSQTLQKTVGTLRGPQHPAYDVSLAGQGELVLTELSAQESTLFFPKSAKGRFFLQSLESTRAIVEVAKDAGEPMRLALAPGRYRVQQIGKRGAVSEQIIVLATAAEIALDPSKMVPVSLTKTASKGTAVRTAAVRTIGLLLSYDMHSGFLQQSGLMQGARLGASYRHSMFRFGLTGAFAQDTYSRNDNTDVRARELSGAALADLLFLADKSPVFVGIEVGTSLVWQRARSIEGTVTPRSPVFRANARLGYRIRPHERFFVELVATAGPTVLKRDDKSEVEWTLGTVTGLGFLF